jgi:opacity protein-like surface antigen
MDSDFVKMILGAALRHAAGAAGGWLFNQGLVDNDGKTQVAGAIMVLGAVAWSWWKKAGAARAAALVKSMAKTAAVAVLLIAASITMQPAFAADVATKAPAFTTVNPFAQPYDIGHCGAYFGVNTIGSAGSLQGTGVSPGTQVVQAGIGGVLGYGCPINAQNGSFWFAEVMVDATNINGASNGISFANAPVSFTERFGVGSPLQNMLASLPGASSVTGSAAVPSLPTLPNGITAGPGAPYGFFAFHQKDVSAQLGIDQNKQWLLSYGLGAGLLYRLSNGVVADVFAEYQIASQQVCVGPLGNAGCAKFGAGFMTGVQFKY